jgi:tRNA-splicing ligase RtcB
MTAPLACWWAKPPPAEVRQRLEQLRRLPDVQRVAVLPDVHLGGETCVGVAVATLTTLYPDLVGNDVGCGVAAAPLYGAQWSAEAGPTVLAAMSEAAPIRVRPRDRRVAMPAMLADHPWPVRLSEDGTFGTLGRGNHFLELQQDEDGLVWLTVHTGSRALGPAVQDWYRARASPRPRPWLDADSPLGARYLADINACGFGPGRTAPPCSPKRVRRSASCSAARSRSTRPSRSTTTTCSARCTTASSSLSTARGRSARLKASSRSSPARWARRPSTSAGGATAPPSARPRTGQGAASPAAKPTGHVRPDDLRRQLGDVLVDPRKLDRLVSEAPEGVQADRGGHARPTGAGRCRAQAAAAGMPQGRMRPPRPRIAVRTT